MTQQADLMTFDDHQAAGDADMAPETKSARKRKSAEQGKGFVIPNTTWTRAVDAGLGYMYSKHTCDDGSFLKRPILLRTEKARGGLALNPYTVNEEGEVSLKSKGEASKEHDYNSPNPVADFDRAELPYDSDTLVVSSSLRFTNQAMAPHSISCARTRDYQKLASRLFAQKRGFRRLSELSLGAIVNGGALYRNRLGYNRKAILTNSVTGQVWEFAIDTLTAKRPATAMEMQAVLTGDGDVGDIIELMERGLTTENGAFFNLEYHVTLGAGQEIYPSQEFLTADALMKEGRKEKHLRKGKVLAYRECRENPERRIAVMHQQKIANAVRRYDIWHSAYEEFGAIAVEPMGYSSELGQALRFSCGGFPAYGKNFYEVYRTLPDIITELEAAETVEDISPETMFFFSVIMRGGLYNGDEKTKKEKGKGKGN